MRIVDGSIGVGRGQFHGFCGIYVQNKNGNAKLFGFIDNYKTNYFATDQFDYIGICINIPDEIGPY